MEFCIGSSSDSKYARLAATPIPVSRAYTNDSRLLLSVLKLHPLPAPPLLNVTLNFTVPVPENGFFGQGSSNLEFPNNPTNLPALCAVGINIKSSDTSSHNFGLFLLEDWNQRTMTAGNGGFGGGINCRDMANFSHYGFAAISTDTGHNSSQSDGTWALNHPKRIIDWGYRTMDGSVALGKQIIGAYHGGAIAYNYYASCSTGGRQGLKEIQQYPEDFDGIAVGAPSWWVTHLQPWTEHMGITNLTLSSPGHINATQFAVYVTKVTN